MKSVKMMNIDKMEVIKDIFCNHPNQDWCTQNLKISFKDGLIKIEHIFFHPIWGEGDREIQFFRGTREEALKYSRMSRWD